MVENQRRRDEATSEKHAKGEKGAKGAERAGGPREFREEDRGERTSRLGNSQGQRAATQTGSSGTVDQGGKFAQGAEERGVGQRTMKGRAPSHTHQADEGPDEE